MLLFAELSDAERDDFEERAAVRQHLGGQARADAEADALADVERARARNWDRRGPLRADVGAISARGSRPANR